MSEAGIIGVAETKASASIAEDVMATGEEMAQPQSHRCAPAGQVRTRSPHGAGDTIASGCKTGAFAASGPGTTAR